MRTHAIGEMIRKAVALAEKNCKSGTRLEVKSPSPGNNEYSRGKQ